MLHYIDTHEGKLEAQPKICRFLKEYHSEHRIDFDTINPMTVRLVSFERALDTLRSEITTYNPIEWGYFDSKLFKPSGFNTTTSFESPGSVSKEHTSRLPILQPKRKSTFEVYEALHSFFSNGGSCLERLALEINKLCDLNIPETSIGFSYLKDYHPLKNMWPDLYSIMQDDKAKEFMKYRNREIHDGAIILKHENTRFLLPDNPLDKDRSIYSKELGSTCQEYFTAIESLIDDAYEQIWKHITRRSLPFL